MKIEVIIDHIRNSILKFAPARCIYLLLFLLVACHSPVHNNPTNDSDFQALFDKSRKYMEYPYHIDSAMMVLRALLPEQQGYNRAKVLNLMGASFDIQGKYDSAAYYLYEASRIADEVSDDSLQISVYTNLGMLQFALKNADESVAYYQKALAIAEKIHHAQAIANLLNNIGNTYMTLTLDYDKAIHWLERCMEASKEMGYVNGCRTAGFNLAQIYNEMGELDKAKSEINRIIEQYGYDRFGGYLLGVIDYKKGNYRQAVQTFQGLLTVALITREFEVEILKMIAETYKASGNLDSTVFYLEKTYALRDSLHKQQTVQTIYDLKISYETEKKEHELERQQRLISRQNMERGLLAACVAICVFFLTLLWYMLRLRTRRNLALTERNDALAETNATKDKFFSIISHDLKNPAVAQRDALQMLFDHVSEWEAATLNEYCGELLQSADNQVELLYNLLNWAQVQTGRMTCQPETFNLTQKLRSDISLVRKMADKKGVALQSDMPEEVFVTGDAVMLPVVVRNLLTNAVKFTPAGGTVKLDISPTSPVSPKYTVAISDTGVGMTTEQVETWRAASLQRIHSLHSHTGTSGETGTGLGLIVCREMLEKHGTTLHIESREGEGSRFWFELRVEK